MDALPRIRKLLWGLAAALAATAVVAWAWPVTVSDEVIRPEGIGTPPTPSSGASAADPSSANTVIVANIFSAKRSAPSVRYDPLAPADAGPAAATGGFEASAGFSPTDPADPAGEPVPKLYGTIVGPQGAAALMRLDPDTPGAKLYRVGDRGGEHRVVAIEARSVVLSGPEGRVTLTLPSAENRSRAMPVNPRDEERR